MSILQQAGATEGAATEQWRASLCFLKDTVGWEDAMRRKKTSTLSAITRKASALGRKAETLIGKVAKRSGLVGSRRRKAKTAAAATRRTRKAAKAPRRTARRARPR
jgi:hypothetical protein